MQHGVMIEEMGPRAEAAAALLKALANPARLRMLCRLVEGECSAGALEQFAGLGQSAVSQHLAVLRREGIVSARREGSVIHYSIASAVAAALLAVLYEAFCKPGMNYKLHK